MGIIYKVWLHSLCGWAHDEMSLSRARHINIKWNIISEFKILYYLRLKMKYLLFLILIALSIIFFTKFYQSIYEQGKWNYISYTVANGSKEKSTARINLTHSEAIVMGDRIRLLVYFKIENTDNYPISFAWENKYIMSDDSIYFKPIRGRGVKDLQTYSESNGLYAEYNLPTYVNLDKIYWGLYDTLSHSMRYKIQARPTIKTISYSSEPRTISAEELLNEKNKLIGTEIYICCKGSQFINLNNNIFSAACRDIDSQFPQINYDIGFKVPDKLLSIVNKIKNKSLKFCTTGKVEWANPPDYMRKVIVTVESIEIK